MTRAADNELMLRSLAASAERRNQPRALLIAAVALLGLATMFALAAGASAAKARSDVESASRQRLRIAELAAESRAHRTIAATRPAADQYRPDTQLLGRLHQISDQLGMTSRPGLAEERARSFASDPTLVGRRVNVTFSGATLEQALQWINLALKDAPGLYVSAVEMRPMQGNWFIAVSLARWETKQ